MIELLKLRKEDYYALVYPLGFSFFLSILLAVVNITIQLTTALNKNGKDRKSQRGAPRSRYHLVVSALERDEVVNIN